jgi:hypothetical protein
MRAELEKSIAEPPQTLLAIEVGQRNAPGVPQAPAMPVGDETTIAR